MVTLRETRIELQRSEEANAVQRAEEAVSLIEGVRRRTGCKVAVGLLELYRSDLQGNADHEFRNHHYDAVLGRGIVTGRVGMDRNHPGWAIPRDGHPTPEGAAHLAEQVADLVEKTLAAPAP